MHAGHSEKRDPELAALDVLPSPERLHAAKPAQAHQPSSSPPPRSGVETSGALVHRTGVLSARSEAVPGPLPPGRQSVPACGRQAATTASAAAATVRGAERI